MYGIVLQDQGVLKYYCSGHTPTHYTHTHTGSHNSKAERTRGFSYCAARARSIAPITTSTYFELTCSERSSASHWSRKLRRVSNASLSNSVNRKNESNVSSCFLECRCVSPKWAKDFIIPGKLFNLQRRSAAIWRFVALPAWCISARLLIFCSMYSFSFRREGSCPLFSEPGQRLNLTKVNLKFSGSVRRLGCLGGFGACRDRHDLTQWLPGSGCSGPGGGTARKRRQGAWHRVLAGTLPALVVRNGSVFS
jgi:hypothetical protein